MRNDDFFLILVLTIVFVTALWLVDISVSALLLEEKPSGLIFDNLNPNKTYHVGLLLLIITFVITVSYSHFIFLKRSQPKPMANGTNMNTTDMR